MFQSLFESVKFEEEDKDYAFNKHTELQEHRHNNNCDRHNLWHLLNGLALFISDLHTNLLVGWPSLIEHFETIINIRHPCFRPSKSGIQAKREQGQEEEH